MGCSDRFDTSYCQFKFGLNSKTNLPFTCAKETSGGIYCSEHRQPLRKEDIEHTIATLKQSHCLVEWIENK